MNAVEESSKQHRFAYVLFVLDFSTSHELSVQQEKNHFSSICHFDDVLVFLRVYDEVMEEGKISCFQLLHSFLCS